MFRLGEGLEQTHIQCLAWALMSNHYHLLLRVSDQPLSKLMSRLLSGYATQYNIRKRRSGYVFQNRYKSILCNEDEYLLELVRYIHLNPLKVKIVRTLSEFRPLSLDRSLMYYGTSCTTVAVNHGRITVIWPAI